MYTPSPLAPHNSPVPGVIPDPVRVGDETVVDDALGGNPDRPAAPRRWPTRHATPPTRADLAPDVHAHVPAGARPAGKLDATSRPRGPGTGSQTKEG